MSDNFAEPRDVGPIAGGDLRASDRDRELVTNVLTTAYSEGRLTKDELDERVAQAIGARTFDDLTPLTRDLVTTGGSTTTYASTPGTGVRPVPSASASLVDTSHVSTEPERLVAIFGGASRKGDLRVRPDTECLALFGGVDLDWRDATFEAETVEIRGAWVFGGLDIKLPDGVHVRDETTAIFGGADVKDTAPAGPGVPTVVIKGMCLFGGVSVRGPKQRKLRRP